MSNSWITAPLSPRCMLATKCPRAGRSSYLPLTATARRQHGSTAAPDHNSLGPGLPLLQGIRVLPSASTQSLVGWQVVTKKRHKQLTPLGTVQQVSDIMQRHSPSSRVPSFLSWHLLLRWRLLHRLSVHTHRLRARSHRVVLLLPISCCGWCRTQSCSRMASRAARSTCCPWCQISSQACIQPLECWSPPRLKASQAQTHCPFPLRSIVFCLGHAQQLLSKEARRA